VHSMNRVLGYLCLCLLFGGTIACGGSASSPTAATPPAPAVGPPVVGSGPNNQPNSIVPQPGSLLTVGTSYAITYNMNAGGTGAVVVGIVITRDDGMEWLASCGTAGTGATSSYSMSGTIGPTDGLYLWAKGHKVDATVLVASGPNITNAPGPCYFGGTSGISWDKAQSRNDVPLNWNIAQ
jgi:hypothetical protein